MTEIAPGLHRLGTKLVNWYLLEHADGIVVFDAGYPKHYAQLERELAARGKRPGDVAALVLTHGDPDHIGFAERLRQEGVPVYLHEAERSVAQLKAKKTEEKMLPNVLRHRHIRRMIGEAIRSGVPKKLQESLPIHDGETLDVPGRPRVVHVPGHSVGLCAFHLPDQRAVIAGDSFCTLNAVTGETGPQITPPATNVSTSQAKESIQRLADLDADLVLPGHGEPWRGSPRELVEQIGRS